MVCINEKNLIQSVRYFYFYFILILNMPFWIYLLQESKLVDKY